MTDEQKKRLKLIADGRHYGERVSGFDAEAVAAALAEIERLREKNKALEAALSDYSRALATATPKEYPTGPYNF